LLVSTCTRTRISRERKHADAQQLYDELLTPAMRSRPESAGLLRGRAEFLTSLGQSPQALADIVQATEFEPGNHLNYHLLGPLLAAAGEAEPYRRFCQQVIARFGGTNDPVIAARMARDCLILPASGVDLAAVGKLAETAVVLGTNPAWLPYVQFTKGLAEYRQGHYAGSQDWAQKSLAGSGTNYVTAVAAGAVLAMAQQQLRQTDDARKALAKAAELSESKIPKLESGDLGENWPAWLIARILLREAREVVEAK
jgi:tetratricopeptide (TPR) repeat protein